MPASKYTPGIFLFILFISLLVTAQYNFLLFHSCAEIFSIIIACGIFMFAWNSRDLMKNNYLMFMGIAFLFIAVIDLLHTFSYQGMGIFTGYNADLPTQLWVTARTIEALSFIMAALFFKRQFNTFFVFSAFFIITAIILASIFTGRFPSCFTPETGLTPFKVAMEYFISICLLLSGILLYLGRNAFEKEIYRLIILSIALTILSELFFTFYVSVDGISNMTGHMLKVLSFYLIYKALIQIGFKRPYALLFRDLSKRESELRAAISNIKTLSGLLPICASCKKIRDDKGYWNMLETYIGEHTDAEFTHSICPDCSKKLYPEIWEDEYFND